MNTEIITTTADAVAETNESMSLTDVIGRLRGEAATRVDAVVDTGDHAEMAFDRERGKVVVRFDAAELPEIDGRALPATTFAHSQIAARAKVPAGYYKRMLAEAPELLARNVNHWWDAQPEARLVRAVGSNGDGRIRAVLSDRFRVLDNIDFLTTVFEAADPFGASVRHAHVTDDRLHVQLVTPRVREVPNRVGDALQLGITIRNSEVGDGRIMVQPWVLRLVCLNGMLSSVSYKKTHLGATLDVGVLSDETLRLEAASVWAQVADWTRYALAEERFDDMINDLGRAADNEIHVKPRVAVANVVRKTNLNRAEGQAILEKYLSQDDPTQFGLAQAITYVAHTEVATFRRRVELEAIGGELIAEPSEPFLRSVERDVTSRELERTLGIAV